MLVLSRKTKQSIHIGDVVISINQIKGNKVSLGIEAPQEVRVLRGEKRSFKLEAAIKPEANKCLSGSAR